MCIKHVQFYECPSEPIKNPPGHNPPKKHRVRANILCSQVFPCPAPQWEKRVSRYGFMCPACSGESPAVPRDTPVSDEWKRDELQDEAWVQSYLSEYCHAVLLWIRSQWGAGDDDAAVAAEAAESWLSAFFMERRCKENDHRVGECRCEANGPLAYFYNPTTAARRYLTDLAADKLEGDPRVRSPEMQVVLANRHMALSAVCRERNLYFKDGISRQPFFSERNIGRRRRILQKSLDDAAKTADRLMLENAENAEGAVAAGAGGGRWTAAHTLETARVSRRASLVRFMGEVLLYDNGISNGRFSLAVSWLAHVIQVAAWRTASRVEGLEKLARMASEMDQASMPSQPFTRLVQLVQKYYFDRRAEWKAQVMKYKARRSVFDRVTAPIDPWRELEDEEGWRSCRICKGGFYVSPANMTEQSHPGVDMGDYGEPAWQMKDCWCIFGRRCLFQWITDTSTAAKEPECPGCGMQFPFREYQLVEASTGYSIRNDPPGDL
ncbi:hypothetical protein CGRA01v4_12133 [Colletotrichum graminicola]|uniref:Uncharacterized protein n=1 Tax=Colletotrichum graminicola (strain M1.001 / M2 / FGSC 10212) TaxID=645133 RepID=E3QT85_COLGM|nr:uncharacterized protein GLRG_09217 [Colletotrichum graminicola M1.001]EFQ34073.1 hypothetical protein GLRG_09217 [Colletotrichum graminicola M1.001]WDK20844.1 hypothetical protein CGRA01v4_12133 [Colletotrichum graminicola]